MRSTILYTILAVAFSATSIAGTTWSDSCTSINGQAFPSLLDVTTEELITGLESGLFTSVDLVNAYIARIAEVNGTNHAVTQLNPDALTIAQALDDERANGTSRGPLHGIPVLIKNNIATFDSMDNTAGSYVFAGAKVPRDSTMAAKLRQAGAVILGKTNLSQWANFRSDNSSNGWSAIGGQVIAAYFPDQDPSGSSSGSGVSSSLALAHFCLGSETDGSIISPSDASNLVGIKPSVGLTSRSLVIPISEHQDTVGPMARTVKDAAYLLNAIAGFDENDNYTSAIPYPDYVLPDYVAACNFSALSGVPAIRNSPYAPILDSFDTYAIPLLKAAGAIIVENTTWPGYDTEPANRTSVVLEGDFVADLIKYIDQLTFNPNNVTDLADVRNFTQSSALEDYPDRDTGVWDQALDYFGGQDNTTPEFWSNYTLGLELAGPQGIIGSLTNYSLDALILPTYFASHFPAILGTPVVTVPMGSYPAGSNVTQNNRGDLNATGPGIPFGLSFVAEKWSEEKLIGLAYAFEQRSMVRDKVQPLPENVPKTEIADVVGKRKGRRASVEVGWS
ncbi:putative amidase [Cyphellophora attinorum]|uniref:Putative amidase n=1 Tax=Cyphellophora attinorum TaxID=1664694 RepID=A0A0N0NJP1_9EURO|nr:putative amidase [Phialophora attinorum]KPI37201.1 putative amidase [Phialophora attinorum]